MTAVATDELCYLSITELAKEYAARRLSPVDVTEAYLARIARLEGELHCYITVTADLARAAARQSEQRLAGGGSLGPLDGVPLALKDLYDTAGVRTTAHSPIYAERVPDADATVVARLKSAGAVLLGKHAMHEFAYSGPELDAIFPPARNPWDTTRVPGGSSSGSAAAVAAGECAGAIGSDTGGSIRVPSSYCGIVGLKPTFGLISRHGSIPFSWSFDHPGPMARTVEDAAILLEELAAYDPADTGSLDVAPRGYRAALEQGVAGLRIGAPIAAVERAADLDPSVLAAYHESLRVFQELGATVRSVELPEHEHAATVWFVIAAAEAFAVHERNLREHPEKLGRRFRMGALQGALFGAAEYVQAQRGRSLIASATTALMREVDLIVLPATPHAAQDFAADGAVPFWKRTSFTRLFSVTGQPAISVPCGTTAYGLPLGLQIVGRVLEDDVVLAAARAFERATDWSGLRPPLGAS